MKSIDKYGSICWYICPNCPIDITLSIWDAQLHMYIYLYITIVFDMLSIV